MGQSLSTQIDVPPGSFIHKASGSVITAYFDGNGAMRHKVQEHGLVADYPVAYSVGHGIVGRSFIINLNGHLFQSPASFYNAKNGWDVSPGYQNEPLLDFTRPIRTECMTCHAGSFEQRPTSVALTPISCERCHGPPEKHLKNPVPGTIVNPAKLAIRERNSVCEQCHLEGATAVLNPGSAWSDFKPGTSLESVESHYVFRAPDGSLSSLAAVSHAEQLAVSACARLSAGKLWCGTCHDPHGEVTDRKAQMKQICSGCHAAGQIASVHPSGTDDCVACHMPRLSATDVAHAAVTDHRILKRPEPVTRAAAGRLLAAWQPVPAEIAQRNLGLAYFHIARQDKSGPEFHQAFNILSREPQAPDAEVSAALGYMLLGTNRGKQAIAFFQAATEAKPGDSEYWLDLGVAQQAAADYPSAISDFSRAIQLDAFNYRPYKALSDLYETLGRHEQSVHVIREYLTLVPQSLTLRLPK